MEIIEAIKKRKSIRGFKPDPVPKEVLYSILETSLRAPSANNTQPWEFVVLAGRSLDAVREANLEQFARGAPFNPGIPIPRDKWPHPYRRRQLELGIELFRLMGITRDDTEGKIRWAEAGLSFFGAPAAILICVDESDKDIVYLFDCGTVAQTIALVALDHGLGTCIQRHVTNYPDAVRAATGLADTKRIVIGIAVGYPDPDSPVFRLESKREPIDQVTTWVGF